MLLLRAIYYDYVSGGIKATESSHLCQAQLKLTKSLTMIPSFRNPLNSPPIWNREELLCIITKLEGGYVYLDTLLKEVKWEAIISLIEYKVVYLRPYYKLCNDLYPHPKKSHPIITAYSPLELYVMKELI